MPYENNTVWLLLSDYLLEVTHRSSMAYYSRGLISLFDLLKEKILLKTKLVYCEIGS